MMTNLFAGFPWRRLLAVVIIPQIVGMVWYGPLFGKVYQKELGVTQKDMENGKNNMGALMVKEIVSRLVYFLGLGCLLQYIGMDHKWETGLLYFLAVLSTERSAVIRGKDLTRRMRAMRASKVALDTAIALMLYGMF